MSVRARCRWAALTLLLALSSPLGAAAKETSTTSWLLVAEGGVLGLDGAAAAFAGLEIRFRPVRWGIYPLGGFLASADGSSHVRLGLGRDFRVTERFVVALNSAAGYWERGDGPDLGHDLEFRSALDLACRLREDLRVGLTVAHLSNASIADSNPGVETLSLSVAWRP